MMCEMIDSMNSYMKSQMNNIHTAMPAKIVAYKDGKVDAQPTGKFFSGDSSLDYPMISGCPVFVTGTEGTEIAAPIKVGDSCLLIFAEQSISNWLKDAQEADTNEKWQLTNAIAICGLRRVNSAAQEQANSSNSVVIQGKLTINGDITVTGHMDISGGIDSAGNVNAPNIE